MKESEKLNKDNCSSCCDNMDNIEIVFENNSGVYGNFGTTKKIFKCKVCGKNLMF